MGSFLLGIVMMLSGWVVAIFEEQFGKYSMAILLPIMFIIDSAVIFFYWSIGLDKLTIGSGVIIGTLLKLIIFALYNKYNDV